MNPSTTTLVEFTTSVQTADTASQTEPYTLGQVEYLQSTVYGCCELNSEKLECECIANAKGNQ